MAIESQNAGYADAAQKWAKCRDAVAGQDAVHKAGEKYLPKLKDQDANEYKAMMERTTFFNASGRTLEGLVGLVFRKDPVIDAPASMESILADIDLQGTTAASLAQHLLYDVLGAGRIGVLVEYPQISEEKKPKTEADRAALNLRSYASVYSAESIWDWKVSRINNVMQPVMVKLYETYSETVDEFTENTGPQLRALLLIDGKYLQRVYRKNDKGKWEQWGEDIIPLKNGKPLSRIPFFPFGPQANDLTIQDAPLLDLVNLNLMHYRVTCDYEHGCHFTGLPTPVISGYTAKEGEKLYIGSTSAWIFDHPEAKATFLEFTGQGLTALKENLESKEKQMAAIGARMLEQQKNGVESEGAMQMRSNGENSVLGSIANLVSQQLTRVLEFMRDWEGATGDVKAELNTDFMPVGMTPQKLSELMKAWQGGGISKETLFWNLQQGEVIAADRTFEQEEDLISAEGAPPGGEE